MKKLKLLLLFFLFISIKSTYAQLKRTFNNDTIFYSGNKWNTKIDNQLIPFDSTLVIIKFNKDLNQEIIINYLQVHQIELVDSLYDFKLCKLSTGINLSRRLDSLSSTDYFEFLDMNKSCTPNTADPLNKYQIHINPLGIGVGSETVLNVTNTHNTDSAWKYTSGNPKIIVAVIDAYPDWSHDDIGMGSDSIENIWKNPGEDAWSDPNDPTKGDSIDNDGNGYIDDWKGWDFFNNSNDVRPRTIYDVHGTNVAGVIAAKRNNSKGISGIAGGNYLSSTASRGVRIMTINIYSSNIDSAAKPYGTFWDLAEAIDYSAKNHARIIALSTSTGSSKIVPIIHEALLRAKEIYNCSIFCSAGNGIGFKREIQFPASDVNVYSIGAINVLGDTNKYCIGNYEEGLKLDFVALGEKIVTTSTNNSYEYKFGQTSAASPQASGVAALLYSYQPCLNDQTIYEAMKLTASKYVGQNTYEFEDNTNSNTHGYGLPDATAAVLLIKSYIINNYNINTSTVWNSPKIAKADIKISYGNTLTIKSTLIMSENTKIIVEAGGNLIIDSGIVTSNCGWKGVEVYGLANVEQNSSTFGEVYIKNKGKIEGAWIGIHSFNGGIIHSTDSAIFRNNDQSILIEKHNGISNQYQFNNTKFIAEGPFKPSYIDSTGSMNGIHSFIKTIDVSTLAINSCTFYNNFENSLQDNGIGIHAMNANSLNIYNSTFNGINKAVEVTGIGGLSNTLKVEKCNFSNVLQGIRVINMITTIKNNTFELTKVSKLQDPIHNLHGSFGIYAHSCVNSISGNTFNSENGKSYGVILRNTRSFSNSYLHHNIFSSLKYGTQIEQYNKTLSIFCNEYSNISANAWSVNPFYVGSGYFPMQGVLHNNLQSNERRAGNLFFDRELTNGLQRHIRTSVDFIYNAANEPSEALPEYYSNILTVSEHNELNSLSCEDSSEYLIYCGESICNVTQLLNLLANTENSDSITIYKQAVINSFVKNNQIDDAYDKLIEWNDNDELNELLFQTSLNLQKFTFAQSILNSIDTTSERGLDFFNYYNIILNHYKSNLDRDSLTSTQLATIEDIASRTNDISDLAMAYLNFYKNGTYLMNPEEWEEESSRPINSEVSPSIKPLKNKKSIVYSFSLFPNPTNGETFILINTKELEFTFNIEVIDAIGNIQLKLTKQFPNEKIKLNTSFLTSGIYIIKVSDENSTNINKRLVILR